MTSIASRIAGAFGFRAEANPLDDRFYSSGFDFAPSLAGVNVSRENALKVAVFYRCVSIRANAFASLPVGVYQRGEKRRTEIPNDPLAKALLNPNPWMTSFEWLREMECDKILTGKTYNQILYGPGPKLTFVPIASERVREITKEGDKVRTYEVSRKNGEKVVLEGDRDIWERRSLNGRGLVDLARETLGLAISAERHTSMFLRRGVKASGVLEHPSKLKPETAKAMGASFNAEYGGSEGHAKTPVLWEGMKYTQTSMSNQSAQFAELKASVLEEIATFCGVAPYMVGMIEKQTSWGTGVEEQNLTFIQFTLGPECIHFEQDAARVFLDSDEERGTNARYVKFNQSAFLRGRTKDRFDVYSIAVDKHIFTPNECRVFEDMDPIEGGDEFPAVPGAINGTEPQEPSKDDAPAVPKVVKPGRAMALAQSIAADVLKAEARDLAEIAKTTAADSKRFASAVGSYYGRRAAVVEASMSITRAEAEAYCKEQARLAVAGGAGSLETWVADHTARVVALALKEEVAA